MGFLPCGLVYAMLILSASLATPLHSAAAMLVFGLGTLPGLSAFHILMQRAMPWAKLQSRWLTPAVLVLLGSKQAHQGVSRQDAKAQRTQSYEKASLMNRCLRVGARGLESSGFISGAFKTQRLTGGCEGLPLKNQDLALLASWRETLSTLILGPGIVLIVRAFA